MLKKIMDYKKKSLNKLNKSESYEEIDTRLASGWYVESFENTKKKKYGGGFSQNVEPMDFDFLPD